MDRVIIAFASAEAQHRMARLLESEGCHPAGCFFSGADVIRTVRKLGSAAVVCGYKLRDMTAAELASDLRGSAAVLVVSTPAQLALCDGENLFKLASPISRGEFFASLRLIRQPQSRGTHPAPQRGEDERRVIEQAKALLMGVNRMTESEAHRFLQKRSMDTGRHLAQTAQFIIESYLH